jgi:DNA topoisomerase I
VSHYGAPRRVDVSGPGYSRRRAGKGFTYLDRDGERITDPEVVDRIRGLVIPPAWTDVWICEDPRGHIQATGLDVRGRRQYLYHTAWRARRDRAKHDRMLAWARALPRLRRRLARDLCRPDVDRERVLAAAVRLLELGLFRVGGEAYAEENGSYGLATLRKGHVRVQGPALRFSYPGKSGQQRRVVIRDPRVAAVVRALKRRRGGGPELLAYKDERGRWVDVTAADINAYIRDALGPEFSAKDFRTWTATVLAAVALACEEEPETERQARMAVARAVREVADQLGNTPAVARGSYVDPRVIERFEAGQTVGDELDDVDVEELSGELFADEDEAAGPVPPRVLAEIEAAVVELIESG